MEDLLAIYDSLCAPTAVDPVAGEAFDARPVRARDHWRIAKSSRGHPTVLVAVAPAGRGDRPVAVELENLSVEHNVLCSVFREGGERVRSRYSIIRCLSDDSEVQGCFLRTIGGALLGMGQEVEASDLARIIDRMVALFRLMRMPRGRTIRGLWAELFVIVSSRDPMMMIEAWHNDSMERFDFSLGSERLEVKSAATRSRERMFSFEQVYPPSGASVLIASVCVEERANGMSLGRLWDSAADAVPNAEARLKVERVCIQALGQDLSVGRTFSADWAAAVDSLAFYDVRDIPRPPFDCPPGVSQVRFRSDLSMAIPVGGANLGTFHRCCVGA